MNTSFMRVVYTSIGPHQMINTGPLIYKIGNKTLLSGKNSKDKKVEATSIA